VTERVLRVEVDDRLCAASESCVFTAPNTFRMAGDVAAVIVPPGDDESTIVDAAVACPMQAIRVFDAQTGEDVRP
jgi:ferredoxin